MAVHFSPKILGQNDEIFRTVFGQSGIDFWTLLGAVFSFVLLQKIE